MTRYLVLTYIAGGIVVVSSLVFAGYYPLLSVNGDFMSGGRFRRELQAELSAQEKLKEIYGDFYEAGDLETEILNAFVEDSLVFAELRREIDGRTLRSLTENKINSFENEGDLREAAREIYGISFEDMKKIFLLPLARRDILRSHFLLKDMDLDEWMAEAKKSAKVRIFSKKFRWDEEKVVRR